MAPFMLMSVAFATTPATPVPSSTAAQPTMSSVSAKDLKLIEALDSRYQKSKSITSEVEKNLKLGLLGQERRSKGKLWMSDGRLRMELEGSEKSLLVIDKKNLWAVTYPEAEFKDAPVQVIKGETSSKKGRSQNMVSLLTQGGFLKFFKATAVQKDPNGESVYFLVPGKEQTDFKRAQIRVSKDGQQILELSYWDARDNETRFKFISTSFGTKSLDDKLFKFTPPPNSSVMPL